VERAVDERLELGRLRWAAARCEGNSGGGELEAGLGRVEVLEKGVEKQLVKGIGTGWRGLNEFQQRAHGGELGAW
jgi:hypothetical protein